MDLITIDSVIDNNNSDDDDGIKSILKMMRIIKPFPAVSERYYQNNIYKKRKDGHNYDQIVLLHSNRLVIKPLLFKNFNEFFSFIVLQSYVYLHCMR